MFWCEGCYFFENYECFDEIDPFRLPFEYKEATDKQRLLHYETASLLLRSLSFPEFIYGAFESCCNWNREMLDWVLIKPNSQDVFDAIEKEYRLIQLCDSNGCHIR